MFAGCASVTFNFTRSLFNLVLFIPQTFFPPSSCLAPAPPAAAARCKVAVVDLAVFKLKQLSRITRCESSKSCERLEVYLN